MGLNQGAKANEQRLHPIAAEVGALRCVRGARRSGASTASGSRKILFVLLRGVRTAGGGSGKADHSEAVRTAGECFATGCESEGVSRNAENRSFSGRSADVPED